MKKHKLITHGLSSHPLYKVYYSIKSRCYLSTDTAYHYYGGRGIVMCQEWKNSFISFYDWCITNGWVKGLDIDRRENDENYEPANCRLVERKINTRNKRKIQSNNTTGYRGVTKIIKIYKSKKYIYFVANITVNNKKIYLGNFKTPLLAARTYDKYATDNNLEHTRNFSD